MSVFRYMNKLGHVAFGLNAYEKAAKLYAEQQLLPDENTMIIHAGRPSKSGNPKEMFDKLKTQGSLGIDPLKAAEEFLTN
jgi:hypothetical protein